MHEDLAWLQLDLQGVGNAANINMSTDIPITGCMERNESGSFLMTTLEMGWMSNIHI